MTHIQCLDIGRKTALIFAYVTSSATMHTNARVRLKTKADKKKQNNLVDGDVGEPGVEDGVSGGLAELDELVPGDDALLPWRRLLLPIQHHGAQVGKGVADGKHLHIVRGMPDTFWSCTWSPTTMMLALGRLSGLGATCCPRRCTCRPGPCCSGRCRWQTLPHGSRPGCSCARPGRCGPGCTPCGRAPGPAR